MVSNDKDEIYNFDHQTKSAQKAQNMLQNMKIVSFQASQRVKTRKILDFEPFSLHYAPFTWRKSVPGAEKNM